MPRGHNIQCFAEVHAISPSGVICEDTTEYEFFVGKVCNVEIEI